MLPLNLHPNNSTLFQIALTNNEDGAPVNNATVKVKLLKPDNSAIMDQVVVPYQSGSNGKYQLTTAPISGLVSGITYNVIFHITEPGGLTGQRSRKIMASEA